MSLEKYLDKKPKLYRTTTVRLEEEEYKMLNELVVRHQVPKSQILRALIQKEFEDTN